MKLLKNILIFFLAFIVFVFALTGVSNMQGKEEITDGYMLLAFVLAVFTPVVTTFFAQYNHAMAMKHSIASKRSDIKIVEERSEDLLDKFNTAIYEARQHEEKFSTKSINTTSKESSSYDNDKAGMLGQNNSATSAKEVIKKIEKSGWRPSTEEQRRLLDEIKECANTVANFKIHHNEFVAAYNMAIYKLPLGFFRNLLGLKEEEVL